jgi:hypothetical protein
VNAAIPLSALPGNPPSHAASLADLAASGVLTEPISAMPEFLYGGTALDMTKKAGDTTPRDVSEFSARDQQIWVYSLWEQKGKRSKGMVSAKAYDEQNRVRVTIAPKKVTLTSTPARLTFNFPPSALKAGTSRIDVIWDNRPVWRTFVHVTE